MPGTRTSCMYLHSPVTFAGISTRGNDLTERRARARSEVDLARVNRHAAGRRQGKEAVDLVERDRLGRRHRLGARLGQWTGQAERDDERARAFEEIPARRRSVEHR